MPLIFNNIFSIAVAVGDTLMAAALGPLQLAAVAIGAGVWIALFLLGLGVVMALGPIVAQHTGGRRFLEIGQDTQQGLWLALAVSMAVVVAMRNAEGALQLIGVDSAVAILAQGYLDALSFGVPCAYAYHVLKQMNEGIGRTLPIMLVMAVALPLNILLNFGFMFGHFYAEPLGAIGSGLGSGIAFCLMYIALALYVLRAGRYQRYGLSAVFCWPQKPALGRLMRLGGPIGLSLFLQSGLFTTVALLIGRLGPVELAAHQIVLNYCGLVFMVPLGLGMALTVCVGQAVGRRDMQSAGRIGFIGIALCGAIASGSCVATLLWGSEIASFYSTDAEVALVASELFLVAAILQFADGVQVAAAFALRGLKDTRVPLLLNAVCYWGIGFTFAYFAGVYWDFGASGIWLGLTLGLAAAAVSLTRRFAVVTRRLRELSSELRQVSTAAV